MTTAATRNLALRLALVPLALLLGSIAARLALRTAPARIAVDLAQPLPVVTSWAGFGAEMWGCLALATLLAAAAALAALRALRETTVERPTALRLVAISAVLSLAAALSWPVLFSSDVYAYAAYGEEALRGLDPYAPAPAPASDPFLAAAAWQWSGSFPACVYGGAFVAFARSVVAVTHGFGVATTLFAFRLVSSAAFLVACACLGIVARRAGARRDDVVVVAALALNPIALWTAAEGHNDALMLAVALAGCALVARRLSISGGVLMGLASLIKLPGIVVGLAVAAFDALETTRTLRRLWTVAATAAVVVLVFGVPRALAVARGFSGHAHYAPQFSLQGIGVTLAGALTRAPAGSVVGIALALLICTAIAIRGVAATWSGESSGLAWIAIAVWLAIPNPYPWYALWVLPLAVLALERLPFIALWCATISIVVRYLPDAYGSLSPDQRVVIAASALLPLLLARKDVRALVSAREPAGT